MTRFPETRARTLIVLDLLPDGATASEISERDPYLQAGSVRAILTSMKTDGLVQTDEKSQADSITTGKTWKITSLGKSWLDEQNAREIIQNEDRRIRHINEIIQLRQTAEDLAEEEGFGSQKTLLAHLRESLTQRLAEVATDNPKAIFECLFALIDERHKQVEEKVDHVTQVTSSRVDSLRSEIQELVLQNRPVTDDDKAIRHHVIQLVETIRRARPLQVILRNGMRFIIDDEVKYLDGCMLLPDTSADPRDRLIIKNGFRIVRYCDIAEVAVAEHGQR